MTHFSKYLPVAFCAMALTFSSCSNSDDEQSECPECSGGSGSMEQMTPTQSKQYIEQTAREVVGKLNPDDQKEVIEVASTFMERYGDLDMSGIFNGAGAHYAPSRLMKALRNGLMRADAAALSRAASVYVYDFSLPRMAGIYEPGTESWVKTGASDAIVFRFSDDTGHTAELKISGSSQTSDITLEGGEWDYDYDPSTGNWDEWYDTYRYNISLPKRLQVTLTDNGTTLVDGTVNSSINVDGHSFSVNADMTVANIHVTADTEGTDSKVTETSEVRVDGDLLAKTSATVNGYSLCDLDKWMRDFDEENDNYYSYDDDDDEEEDDDDAYVSDFITKGRASVNFLDQVQVYVQLTLNPQVEKALDFYGDNYEFDSQQEALSACQSACDVLNSNIASQIRFNNTATDQATIIYKPALYTYEWGYGWEYSVDGLLYFPKDQTTYTFEDYFSGMSSVQSLINDLIRKYQAAWNRNK